MTPDDARALLARLLHTIAPEVDLDTIDPAAPLQEEAELDSMDYLNLVNALYDETGIDVPERDYPRIGTVDGFAAYVAAAAPAPAGGRPEGRRSPREGTKAPGNGAARSRS